MTKEFVNNMELVMNRNQSPGQRYKYTFSYRLEIWYMFNGFLFVQREREIGFLL